jgi:predicted transcriptional regulator
MRKHNGMRPHDLAILLKIVALKKEYWQLSTLSNSLHISLSEVSESLNRSRIAGLIDYNKKMVSRRNLVEFIEHGFKYVFPQQPGTLVKGIPTAHSHSFMKKMFASDINYVWPDNRGEVIGLEIKPLYENQIMAIKTDEYYYKLLALTDVIRVGKVREVQFATTELEKNILHEQ